MPFFLRSPKAPRRRWRRRLLGCLLVLTLVLGLAPTLIAHTPLLQWITSRALNRLHGQVRVGGAALSWFSPPVLTDIEVQDTRGELLARIPRIEGSRSLVGLLCSPLSPGTVRVVQPTVHLRCTGTRTNLEEALAAWLEDSDDTSGPDLAVRAEVIQAHFLFRDEDTGKETALDPLDLTLERSRDQGPSLHLQVHARSSHAQTPGCLDTDLTLRTTEEGLVGLGIEGTVKADGLPLALAEPFLRRLVPGIQLGGALGADLTLRPGDGGAAQPGIRLEGRLTVRDFSLGAPAWIGVDRIVLKRVEIPCRLALHSPWVHVERAEVQSDVGTFRLAGKVDLSKGLNALLRQPGCDAGLEVDLVRLTDLFPDTLGLSPITRLTQGRLEAHLHSVADARGTHWEGDLSTSELRGLFEGQPVAWKAPLKLDFRTQPVRDGLPLPAWLRCDSDFLQAKATGSEEQVQADLTYDLDRLSAHVRELIDLGGLRLGGHGSAHLTLRQTSPGSYQLEGDATTTKPLLALPGGRVCRDTQSSTHLAAVAEETKQGSYLLKSGNIHIALGPDALDVSLTKPVADLFSAEPLSARLEVHGDLARWQNRLGLAPDAKGGCQLAGQGDLRADLRWETEAVQLQDVKLHCDTFRCSGRGLTLQEPALDLSTSGRWALDTGALTLKTTQLTAPGLVATAPGLSITDQVSGSLALRGDLNRLQSACGGGLSWALPILPGATQVEGEVSLNVNDLHLPLADWTRTQAVGRLTIHSARITPGALVRELSVLLRGPATLTLARDSVVLLQAANGRVYHQGLELQLPELLVRSQGSVGFDGSLSLVVEMPVPPKWLGSSKPAGPLAGKVIRLLVTGTLTQPRLDAQALRAANAQLLRNSAEETIRRELDKRLEKVLPFRK